MAESLQRRFVLAIVLLVLAGAVLVGGALLVLRASRAQQTRASAVHRNASASNRLDGRRRLWLRFGSRQPGAALIAKDGILGGLVSAIWTGRHFDLPFS